MKKIRSFFAVIALVATLSGFAMHGMGSAANAASGHHAGSSFAAGQSTRSVAFIHGYPPCPVVGSLDC